MKKICKSLIVIFTVSWLTAPAYASDPCASVLCLYGKAVGQGGGSECRSAEKDFFNILNTDVINTWESATTKQRITLARLFFKSAFLLSFASCFLDELITYPQKGEHKL